MVGGGAEGDSSEAEESIRKKNKSHKVDYNLKGSSGDSTIEGKSGRSGAKATWELEREKILRYSLM